MSPNVLSSSLPAAAPPPPLVRFDHVSCSYGNGPVIENVDLTVGPGEFVGIVGPSGSGKTTLLRAMLGSVKPVHGSVHRSNDLRVAYVPQLETVDWNFPVTVSEVVAMSRPQRSWWPKLQPDERAEIEHVLEHLGLAGLSSRHIRELSGGQQQRVFLARALMQKPDLLVLDEPTAGVDVRTRHEVLHVLADLNEARPDQRSGESGIAIVLTTHDLNGLAAHLPRLICFNRTVVADGSPSDVLKPYFLERTYGAPMEVLQHGGMPVVLEQGSDELRLRLSRRGA
ncbi:MAG: metal ABC transporter ATP-binding protein [Acidimicrobiia bacterium]|nr:metal ABC transporter ATP-binding protein [Acidimicrobiia bacterium]